jgi:hypothetical protein
MIRGTLAGAPFVGAGVILGLGSDRLYVATANHVVREAGLAGDDVLAEDLEVQLHWLRGEWQPATLLDTFDANLDLAVLAVAGASGLAVPPLAWASIVTPESLVPGEPVVPIGYPGGMPWFVPRQTLVVSNVGPQAVQTEGNLVPGHSGGALATADWGIAGIVRNVGSVLGEASRIDLVVRRVRDWGYPVQATFRTRAPATSGAGGDAGGPATIDRDRQDAESLVGRWLGAMLERDVGAMISDTALPFYFDQQILVSEETLRRSFEAMLAARPEPPEWTIQSIRANTIGEIDAQGEDLQRDRVVRSLSMSDADWRVVVTVGLPGRPGTEGMAFFVRKVGGTMKLVGMWD